jgi:hypothetical protein
MMMMMMMKIKFFWDVILSVDKYFLMIRKILVPLFSGSDTLCLLNSENGTLKTKALRSFETFGTTHPMTGCHISEGLSLYQHRHEDFNLTIKIKNNNTHNIIHRLKYQQNQLKCKHYVIIIIIIIIITMARQPYMGLGLLFPRLRGLCAFCGSEGPAHCRAFQLDPDVSQETGEKWPLEFSLRTLLFLLHARRFFYMP